MELLFSLLLVAAIFAIVWWAVTKMGLPQPAQILVVLGMAIVALAMITGYVPLPHLALRH